MITIAPQALRQKAGGKLEGFASNLLVTFFIEWSGGTITLSTPAFASTSTDREGYVVGETGSPHGLLEMPATMVLLLLLLWRLDVVEGHTFATTHALARACLCPCCRPSWTVYPKNHSIV